MIRLITTVLVLLTLSACGSERLSPDGGRVSPPDDRRRGGDPEASLAAANSALARCDIRAAHVAFDEAYTRAPGSPDAAMGWALTDALLLGEDPAAASGLALFGFTSGIDSEALLWGPGGYLDSLFRHTRRRQFVDLFEATFPYPPLHDRSNGLDAIDPSTSAAEVVAGGWALQPRLRRLVDAFEVAAEHAPVAITFGGGCDLGRVELQAPELFTASAGFQGLVTALELSRAYSWNFPVHHALDWRDGDLSAYEAQAASLNTHLGNIADPSALPGIQEELRRLFDLVIAATDAVAAASPPSADGLVNWPAYNGEVTPTMQSTASAARALVDAPRAAPGLTPSVVGTFAPLYTGDLDLADFGRTFIVQEDPTWADVWLEFDSAPIDDLLMMVLDPGVSEIADADPSWRDYDVWSSGETLWQVDDVRSDRLSFPPDVPRFVAPAVERYIDALYYD